MGAAGQGPRPDPPEWSLMAARDALDPFRVRAGDWTLEEYNVACKIERLLARSRETWFLAAALVASKVADEDMPPAGCWIGDDEEQRRLHWASACGRIVARLRDMRTEEVP